MLVFRIYSCLGYAWRSYCYLFFEPISGVDLATFLWMCITMLITACRILQNEQTITLLLIHF